MNEQQGQEACKGRVRSRRKAVPGDEEEVEAEVEQGRRHGAEGDVAGLFFVQDEVDVVGVQALAHHAHHRRRYGGQSGSAGSR